jgi:hypothetical protein
MGWYLGNVMSIVVGLGLLMAGTASAEREQGITVHTHTQPGVTLVSTSGIPHHDIGNYTRSKFWHEGLPRGINRPWRQAINVTIGQIASENPVAVFHTGDMIDGRWSRDTDMKGIFGKETTLAQRTRVVERAAEFYYRQNRGWWARHGLAPHFGLGDHEVGDVGRSGVIPGGGFKYTAFSTLRRAWARQFTGDGSRYAWHPPSGQHRRTAYATMIRDVGFVNLDPFVKTHNGVHVRIGGLQMRWLAHTLDDLRERGARFLIVQCEIPALGPNHASRSSHLILANGDRLWRLLKRHDVDLLLSAEFHQLTTHSDGGTTPVQVVHGGQLYRGNVSYLVINTFDNRMELQLKRMNGRPTGTDELWVPTPAGTVNSVRMYRGARVVGTMTIHDDGSLSDRTGHMTEGMSTGELPVLRGPVVRRSHDPLSLWRPCGWPSTLSSRRTRHEPLGLLCADS